MSLLSTKPAKDGSMSVNSQDGHCAEDSGVGLSLQMTGGGLESYCCQPATAMTGTSSCSYIGRPDNGP